MAVCVCARLYARRVWGGGVLVEGFIPAPEEHVHRSADPSDVPSVWSQCCCPRALQAKRSPQPSGRRRDEGHAWLMCSWMESYAALRFLPPFPPPLHPNPKLQPKPLPFSITHPSVDQIDRLSLSLCLSLCLSLSGTPLSSTMGLHIWQLGSSRLDAKLCFLKRWTQTSAKIPYISPERLDELATASCCPDPSLDPV